MPVYEYRCSSCEEGFEIEQKMGSAKKKKCPSCKKHKLERLISSGYIFVKGEPQTVEHWADRNTKKMGSYELSEKREKESGKSDSGPWWKKDSKYSNRQINKMSDSQRRRFIEKGD
jgi:putative FmdB family regulatory protein